jgi:Flp pilus assembly pilin Flp
MPALHRIPIHQPEAALPKSRKGVIMIERLLHHGSSDESGQTMAEYAVVLGVITIAVVITLGLLSTAISNTLSNVISSL